MQKNLAFAVNYELRAKFLPKFLPSLAEVSRAAWGGGASGDEGRNYSRGESTIDFRELQCCINPALRPLTFFNFYMKTFMSTVRNTYQLTKNANRSNCWNATAKLNSFILFRATRD
jgi:hypothetical protein